MLKKCRTHPKYKGKIKPSALCYHCWKIWLGSNPDKEVSGSDYERFLASYRKYCEVQWQVEYDREVRKRKRIKEYK